MPPVETFRVPSDPRERRYWILGQLFVRGITLSKLAMQTGVTQQAMSLTLRSPNARLEQVIADALGMPVISIFPDRFSPRGDRLHKVRKTTKKLTTSACSHNVNTPEVA